MMITSEKGVLSLKWRRLRLNIKGDRLKLSSGREIFLPILKTEKDAWSCGNNELLIRHEVNASKADFISISTTIQNNSEEKIALDEILPFDHMDVQTGFPCERAFVTSQSILGPEGIHTFEQAAFSWSLLGMTTIDGTSCCLFGFSDFSHEFYRFSANKTENGFTLSSVCERDGVALQQNWKIADLIIFQNNSLSGSLEEYAGILAKNMKVNLNKEKMTGWCSWYYYYSCEIQDDIMSNVAALRHSPIADKIKVIQIDDGWNLPKSGGPKVWGDWEPGAKFGYDMKAVSDRIHEQGYLSGLWLAPFSVSKDSRLLKEYPEWVLGADGDILKTEDYGLDLTHPQVLEFIRETFTRVFDQWGFDYVKIDFLLHATMKSKKRFDPAKTSVDAYRDGLKIIRECAGDKFVLCCGAPIYPSIGLCDGMRIGPDVGARWSLALNPGEWPKGNCAIKPALFTTLNRHWMHNRLWQNDPDCAVVRNFASEYERRMFGTQFCGTPIKESDFGLTSREADCWSKCLWLLNEMTVLSENYSLLDQNQRQWIERCFTPYQVPVRMVDSYQCDELIAMQNDEIIGIFNLSDLPRRFVLTGQQLCADKLEEVFGSNIVDCLNDPVTLPISPPHSAQIYRKIKS